MFDVLEMIDLIYEAGVDPAHWQTVMKRLGDASGTVDAVLGGLTAGRVPLFIAPRTDPEMVRLYAEHYHSRNPVQLAMRALPIGKAALDSDLTDPDVFRRSEFYNDWCLPQGNRSAVGINVATSDGWRLNLMVSSRTSIDGEALLGLEYLAPHLARAFRMNQILDESRAASFSAFSALELADRAVFIVLAKGICEPANTLAETIVAAADGLVLRNGRLDCVLPADTRLLHRMIAECSLGKTAIVGTMRVTRLQGRQALQLQAIPVPPDRRPHGSPGHQVMIVVTDPDRRLRQKVEHFKLAFKLTPAEGALVEALAQGGDRGVVARRLGISLATVRTQLTNIFDKTEVRRQSDVVRLLMDQL